jgi:glyoxylase-like metal-dependent hydrolase (beta-lactamase superfamily II)
MCREAWEKLEAKLFVQRPLKRIFVTHLHPDHIGLACWLQGRHKVPVWMSERGRRLAEIFAREQTAEEIDTAQGLLRSHGFMDEQILARFFSGKMYRNSISGVPEIARMPVDGESIAIGAVEWRVYETNGHAEGHQCLFDAGRRILISGDQVLPTISSNVSYSPRGGDDNPLKSYLDSLVRLSELDRRTLVLPSHGRPFYGLSARAADLIAHHREHLSAMKQACSQPRTAFDLVSVLFKRRLLGAHWMFAMGETIAHAEYLLQTGDLIRERDSGGIIRYLQASE